jgi:ketosteroid isomerase-like protein
MTTATDHAATVAELYAAFGRGDAATLLDALADDVSWEADWADNSLQRPGGPDYFRPRRGPVQVGEWFASLATTPIHHFEAQVIASGPRHVVASAVIELSTPAGGRLRDEELHLWTFDETGRVAALRHYVDTAKHLAASEGQDTTRGD